MLKQLRAAVLATVLLACGTAAQAHRFHMGITDISFNAKTGSTEIVHTYMSHDIEALLANLYQRQFDLSDPEDEAVLRKYVEKRFAVLAADKRRLPVRWIGVSVGPQSVIIYQEIDNTPLSSVVAIEDQVLVDFLPDQINTVNLNGPDGVRSLTFDREKTTQGI
jgi:hypothetical protein